MCDLFSFNKPSSPPAMMKAEVEQQDMIKNQQAAANAARSEEKRKRTAEMIGRSAGLYGMRSLISGPSGGSGFLSKKAN